MLTEASIEGLATDLARVTGVVGVTLGGSHARGDARPDSDVDLGVHYRADELDLDALQELASRWSGGPVQVAGPGGWGPWVDGGAWLQVDRTAVDWILREVGRVAEQIERAHRGEFAWHAQAGHPLGFLDVAYAGELALSRVLVDPSGELGRMQGQVASYPAALADSLASATWEADFLVDMARKGASRSDSTYVALCLARAFMLCAHALLARADRWVTNEKGLLAEVDRWRCGPAGFGTDAAALVGDLGNDEHRLRDAVVRAERLVASARAML